uniref:Uncharacterized protein n=1 Tax=Arundo donax TaxID=35708 RepID=A0A0A9H4G3_ARUDO
MVTRSSNLSFSDSCASY